MSPSPAAGHHWALVLAAGDGARLQALTTIAAGISVPKQFCSLGGGGSLLNAALQRARVIAPPARTCVIVAAHHERWWRTLPRSIEARNIVVQPRNRGTANGILLPLLQILHRDPEASLLVLPSDHYVRDEAVLAASLEQLMKETERQRGLIVLLGFAPEQADAELGYIVPSDDRGPGARGVCQFVEKPSGKTAEALIERGGLWNSFIFAAHGRALLGAFEERCPEVVGEMRAIVVATNDEALRQARLAELYERLPVLDFSRDIVERCTPRLRVLAVPSCGWSDLGTPGRVAAAVECAPASPPTAARAVAQVHARGVLDLAAQHLRLQQAAAG